MSVHYKFKSALEYDTVTFDGLHISVADLKASIVQQKRLGKTPDFDLQVTNAQTKEVYSDEKTLIPKNTSLLIARVPLAEQPKKPWDSNAANSVPLMRKDVPTGKVVTDLSQMEGSEVDKIKAMITQSTLDYDPSNYQKVRGANQRGEVPASYICYKCQQPGHWIKDCKFSSAEALDIKRSTGIPRSFMVPVEGPDAPGALMTPSGDFAVPVVDHEAYQAPDEHGNGAGLRVSAGGENAAAAPRDIPEDLICSLCRDLLTDAVMIPCCGNSFCDECIRSALLESEDHECPDCREKDIAPTTLIPNRFLRNSVATYRNQTGYTPMPRHNRVVHSMPQQRPEMQIGHNGSAPPSVQNIPQESSGPVRQMLVTGPHQPTSAAGGGGEESDASADDNITVTVPPVHRAPPISANAPLTGAPMPRHLQYPGMRGLRPPGLETPPNHMLGRDEQRAPTPTVDERRDMHSQHRPPSHQIPPHQGRGDFHSGYPSRMSQAARQSGNYNPSYRGGPQQSNYGPSDVLPPHAGQQMPPSHLGRPPLSHYQPPPPGIKDSSINQPTTGAPVDPLEAFERMIREKEELARRRERRRRYSRSHSGSRSRSRTRSPRSRSPRLRSSRSPHVLRSPVRRSRSPRARSPRQIVRSPRPATRSPRPVRSPRQVRSPRLNRSPKSRSRSRTPFSRSRSRSPRHVGAGQIIRRQPPLVTARHHRRSFSISRSRSPSPLRLSPGRPPPLSVVGIPHGPLSHPHVPPILRRRENLRTPPHYSSVINNRPREGALSPIRRGPLPGVQGGPPLQGHPVLNPHPQHMAPPPYNARYNQRGVIPTVGPPGLGGVPGPVPNYPSNLLPLKPQHDLVFRNPRYEDPAYSKQPPVPGYEPPPNRNIYREPLPLQPGQQIPPNQMHQHVPSQQHTLPMPPYRDAYRGDRAMFRDRGFRDNSFRDGIPGGFRPGPYRDGIDYRDPEGAFRDAQVPYGDGPPGPYRENPILPLHNDFEGQHRGLPRNGTGNRDRPYDRGNRDVRGDYRDKYNPRDHREQEKYREGERRDQDRPREEKPRDERSRDDRPREEKPRDDRSREERPRDDRVRDDKSRDERMRDDRSRDRPREERPREEKHDYDKDRERDLREHRDREKHSPDKKRRISGSPPKRGRSREDHSRSKEERTKRTNDSLDHRKDLRKEQHDKEKYDDDKAKEKKIKDKKKKKKEKEIDKKKRREKREKREKDATDIDESNSQDKKEAPNDYVEDRQPLNILKEENENVQVEQQISELNTEEKTLTSNDLYEGIDTDINIDVAKHETVQGNELQLKEEEATAEEKDSSFDGIELQAAVEELDIKLDDDVKEKTKIEMLAPLPELSKWEMDDEQGSDKREPGEIVSPPPDKSGKVTSEVLKRAENAIFAKAINAIRPIEIKKISTDRAKLYAGEIGVEPKPEHASIDNIQITIPSSDNEYRSIEINDPKKEKSEKTPPPKLSVKERLGSKVEDLSRRRDIGVLHSTVERIKSRSKTPKRSERRIIVDSRDKGRRLIAKIDNRNATPFEDQRVIADRHERRIDKYGKRIRDNELDRFRENQIQYSSNKVDDKRKKSESKDISKKKDRESKHKHKREEKKVRKGDDDDFRRIHGTTERRSGDRKGESLKGAKGTLVETRKSTLDEANFEPDYDETLESDGEIHDEKVKKRDRSMTPTGVSQTADNTKRAKITDEEDSNTIKLDLTNVKKQAASDSGSSSNSESSSSTSSSEEERKRRRRKKKSKKHKAKKHSSDSASDSDNSSSDEPKKKKKKRKHKKKSSSKKKKKTKHR